MSDPRENLEIQLCDDRAEALKEIVNPPGLRSLDYRIGTRASFLRRMLAQIALETLPDGPFAGTRPLAGLSTRELDDPAVALLDTWATAADILTFYQERIANEHYLRTAIERRSILELARLVGQELGPGVSASAFLVFSAEDAPGSPEEVRVPRGTKVQSIPGQDELPQTFETDEEIVARNTWNALRPRLGRDLELDGASTLYLSGIDTLVAAGDSLLFVVEAPATGVVLETRTAVVREIVTDADRDISRIELASPLTWTHRDVLDLSLTERFAATKVFALRQRTPFFGHNAPRYGSLPNDDVVKDDPYSSADPAANWDVGRTVWTDSRGALYSDGSDPLQPVVFLERKIPEIVAGSWVVLSGSALVAGDGSTVTSASPQTAVYQVLGITEATRADYALNGESTGLALALPDGTPLPPLTLIGSRVESSDENIDLINFDVRQTTALVVSEALSLAEEPITAPFPDETVDSGRGILTLDTEITGIGAGRLLAVSGERPDDTSGTRETRILLLQDLDNESDPGHTRLLFQSGLEAGFFVRDSVTVNANVVLASHGETVADEPLGSGDAETPNQSMTLKTLPLTFLSAPIPGGTQDTLEVRVDGVLWQRVDTLFAQAAEDLVYTLRIDDDGTTRVQFGDGINGARVPSGEENVVGSYRSGTGLEGNVDADSLQLLQTRPLGIAEVTNPLPASGAAPRDDVEQARANAPVNVRTLGRIVSLSDFDDFTLTFAGISKVRCQRLAGIHLTVAGVGGAAVTPGSSLYDNLFRAIEVARLPGPPLTLQSYEPLPVRIEAQIVVDTRFRSEQVLAAVEAAIETTFAFDQRDLAQPFYAAQVIPVMQAVRGVEAVDLDAFYVGDTPGISSLLQAREARLEGGRIRPAQMLLVEPGTVTLRRRTP
ncbi:MAG: putative baseplate assembly protein [Acidobacteriota bacterium]